MSMSSRINLFPDRPCAASDADATVQSDPLHRFFVIQFYLDPQTVFSVLEFPHFRLDYLANWRSLGIVPYMEWQAKALPGAFHDVPPRESVPLAIDMSGGRKARHCADHGLVEVPDSPGHHLAIARRSEEVIERFSVRLLCP